MPGGGTLPDPVRRPRPRCVRRAASAPARACAGGLAGAKLGAMEPLAAPYPRSVALSRVGWFVLFALPTAVLVTASQLVPDPAGHGTHTQLGLPPCGFMTVTGIPCPGCGLTTSFSHMVRLEVVEAAAANPFGVPLFLVSFFTIPIAALGFVRGWGVLDTLERLQFEKVAIMLALCSVLTWGTKLVVLLLS